MKKKQKDLPKFLFGGTTDPYKGIKDMQQGYQPGVIENPNTALMENDIMMSRVDAKTNNNPLTAIMDMVGGMAMSTGSSMVSKGIGQAGGIGGLFDEIFGKTSAAMGGSVSSEINAEGNEVVETPDGQMAQLDGPSHEGGGIDLNVPDETKIYSQRLVGPDGNLMSDRKISREIL